MLISMVVDEMFVGKFLGDGYVVEFEDGEVVVLVSGIVISVFLIKYVIGLKMMSGLEVLLYMGINIVEMNGMLFKLYVVMGDEIVVGIVVVMVDLVVIKLVGKVIIMMVVIINMDYVNKLIFNLIGYVISGDLIGVVE